VRRRCIATSPQPCHRPTTPLPRRTE
jgi:hypothetical protein